MAKRGPSHIDRRSQDGGPKTGITGYMPRGGAENMTDPGRVRDVNEAARRFAETLAESYRLVYEQASEAGERQQQRAREFSELVASNLREQTEAGRASARRLSEQAQRQQRAGQDLARESVEAYAEF